jgi:drug/metabolite transporter (DMT)-like permease
MPSRRPSTWLIWVALGTVYVIWSTTYLAIRITNETLPPLVAAGTRFLIAGGVLLAVTIRRGGVEGDPVGRRQWLAALAVGALLIAAGNGSVVLAELTVPSGTVALIFALVPLWLALGDRLAGRQQLPARVAAGLVLGFAGAALLVDDARLGGVPISGSLLAVLASMSWAGGSLVARSASLPHRPFVGNAMVMLAGGAITLLWGLLRGEGRADRSRSLLRGVDPRDLVPHRVRIVDRVLRVPLAVAERSDVAGRHVRLGDADARRVPGPRDRRRAAPGTVARRGCDRPDRRRGDGLGRQRAPGPLRRRR